MTWKPAEESHARAFQRLREQVMKGNRQAAREANEAFLGEKQQYGTALPVGELRLRQPSITRFHDYERFLDLESGTAACSFTHAGGRQEQEAFCSWPDRVFCFTIRDPSGICAEISFSENIHSEEITQGFLLSAQALESRHSDGKTGAFWQGCLLVTAEGGTLLHNRGVLQAEGVRELRLTLVSEVRAEKSREKEWADRLQEFCKEKSLTNRRLLKKRHTEDFSAGMNRVGLMLPKDPEIARMFQLGRYLILSAAREDSPAPMNLQGVWNDDVACRIGWTCDMHLDINTQMNYWLCGPGNLPESRKPLLRWMTETLIPEGRKAAGFYYGMPGWSAELVSNLWGFAAPYWNRSLAPCPACGFWQAEDYAEQYRFTRDESLLCREVIPALSGAVDFILAYVFRDEDGNLHCGPSVSPENAFLTEDGKEYADLDMPFEWAAIQGILESWLECTEKCDPPDPRKQAVLDLLAEKPGVVINPDGTLREFGHEAEAADPQHRHMSHLLGLYPFAQIRPETPEAAAAAESIRRRLTPYENWEDTGWARSMLILYSARLGKGGQALFHIREMLGKLTNANGMVIHPSTRGASSFAPVWELDGNTGLAAGVSEMLLQSEKDRIRLLPALPEEWPEGEFSGFGARGGFTVGCRWESGAPVQAEIRNVADRRASVSVVWENKTLLLDIPAGETVLISKENFTEETEV